MSVNLRNGGPAFPFEYRNETARTQEGFFGAPSLSPGAAQQFAGMTLRDYFAAAALQSVLIADALREKSCPPTFTPQVAWEAYAIADAMLAERVKEQQS